MSLGTVLESFKGPFAGGKSLPEGVSHEQPAFHEERQASRPLTLRPAPLPDHMFLGALRHPGLRLKTPLRITFSTENEYVIVECPELNEFGYGAHLTAAIVDLQNTIAELYFTLKEEQARLGSDLSTLWATLQAKIEER